MPDNPTLVDLGEALAALDQVNPLRLAGRVSEVTGLLIRANVPGIRVGELVWIDSTPPGAPPPTLPGASSGGAGRVQADWLEATHQRPILFDVTVVVLRRGGAHALHLAARQRRLDDAGCVQ